MTSVPSRCPRAPRNGSLASASSATARGRSYTALIGIFLMRAAWQYDSDGAVGVDGALQKLTDQTFGPLLLAVVAAGLFAYGLL
jgi:hypothetical protein